MNAERLHAIVRALNEEMQATNVIDELQAVVNSLRSLVQQSTASNQQNLASNLNDLYTSLSNAPSDRFSPTWRQILIEIGGEELFGTKLKQKIEEALAKNQLTPAVALNELERILGQMQQFREALKQADESLSFFSIGDETLEPGNCEVGILVPRNAVKNRLVDFADELKELSFILNTFSEVATGEPNDLVIRTISSSDLLVFLDASAPLAACLAVAIERIVALYKTLLEIRKLQVDIRKQGVPDNLTKGIEEHANQVMERGIEKLSEEIMVEFYKGKDKGRKNELANAVQISLNRIANRIDRGYNLEVRCEPPTADDQTGDDAELKKAIAIVQKASANMQFLKLEGKPLLKLPEHEEKPKKKE